MGLATGKSCVPDIYIPNSDFQIKSINEMQKNSTEGNKNWKARKKTDNAVHFENIKLITWKITSTGLGFQFCTFWRNASTFRVTVGWEEEVNLLYSKDIKISGQTKLRNALQRSYISDKSIYCSINMHQIIAPKTEQCFPPKRRNIRLLHGVQTHKQSPRKDLSCTVHVSGPVFISNIHNSSQTHKLERKEKEFAWTPVHSNALTSYQMNHD